MVDVEGGEEEGPETMEELTEEEEEEEEVNLESSCDVFFLSRSFPVHSIISLFCRRKVLRKNHLQRERRVTVTAKVKEERG